MSNCNNVAIKQNNTQSKEEIKMKIAIACTSVIFIAAVIIAIIYSACAAF
jgi:hypothetical protein